MNDSGTSGSICAETVPAKLARLKAEKRKIEQRAKARLKRSTKKRH